MHGQSSRIPIYADSAPQATLLRSDSGYARAVVQQFFVLVIVCLMPVLSGCGKTVRNTATEQLVLSDSVDRAIRSIDFSPLEGRRCFVDTSYINVGKTTTFVNADYVVSSVRNQLASAGGVLIDSSKDAEVIVEPRLGVLGANEHEVTYGIPSNNLLTQAASIMPGAPTIPTIPELSLARKSDQSAATKLAVFAYEAKSGYPVWQSGVATARSSAHDSWMFGVGPFQSGTIYEKTRFAGARIRMPLVGDKGLVERRQAISLDQEYVFAQPPVAVPPAEEVPQTATSKSNTAAETGPGRN